MKVGNFKKLSKQDLIYKILDHQAIAPGGQVCAPEAPEPPAASPAPPLQPLRLPRLAKAGASGHQPATRTAATRPAAYPPLPPAPKPPLRPLPKPRLNRQRLRPR